MDRDSSSIIYGVNFDKMVDNPTIVPFVLAYDSSCRKTIKLTYHAV